MSLGSNLAQEAWNAYQAGIRGEFALADAWLAEWAGEDGAEALGWAAALRAQRWHAEPGTGVLPTEDGLRELLDAGPPAHVGLGLAGFEAARAEVLRHDAVGLARWKRFVDETQTTHPRVEVGRQVLEAWLALAEGRAGEGAQLATTAAGRASKEQLASYVIETTAIGALCAAQEGDLDTATNLARRSSRMARTEDLPQWQYLANLVLAQVRRLSGAPHLSARIVGALARVVPPAWHRWVASEALLAGALPVAASLALDDVSDPRGEARVLRDLLQATVAGDGARFTSVAEQLRQMTLSWSGQPEQMRNVVCALDARVSPEKATEDVRAWCVGEIATPPGAVKGLCTDLDEQEDGASHSAYVLGQPSESEPGCRGRRIVGLGAPLIRAELTVPKTEGRSERTPATLCALVLAGRQGVCRDDLFRAVYGFGYRHVPHRGLLKTLIHRVRRAVGDAGSVVDEDERFRLILTRSILVPDPRAGRSLEDRVLRLLSRGEGESAKEAAERLGVSLRTAQLALKALVDDGALSTKKVGRSTEYKVEDTTFSEPTRW